MQEKRLANIARLKDEMEAIQAEVAQKVGEITALSTADMKVHESYRQSQCILTNFGLHNPVSEFLAGYTGIRAPVS